MKIQASSPKILIFIRVILTYYMTIFLGPAGIPHSVKGRGLAEGIQECGRLGLTAMEVEFVHSVFLKQDAALQMKTVAEEAGVRLSVHAPYYINLLSEKSDTITASHKRIIDSAERAAAMGADAIAIHAAYYGKFNSEKATEKLAEEFGVILDKMKENGIKNVRLGVETMARESQWGTLDETLELHKMTKGKIVPYIDWAHLFAREFSKIDYESVLKKMKAAKIEHINSHFEGMKYDSKTKRHKDVHVPIGEPPFEPLAKILAKQKVNITLICESPLLEEDALKMKKMLEKEGYRF